MSEPNIQPFLVRDKWFFIINRRFIGPFESRERAYAVYEVAREIAALAAKIRTERLQ